MGFISSAINFFKAIGAVISKVVSSKLFQITTFAVGVKGYLQLRNMLAKGQDILANKTSAGGKIPVIYGLRRVGAQIVYMDTAQNRSKDLFVVYALSVGECEEILGETIEIDGNSILDGKIYKGGGYVGSDKISSGAGSLNTASQVGDVQYSSAGNLGTDPTLRYSFVFNLHHGAASQTADPMLTASISSQWTSNHKLNGIAYIAAAFDYDKKGMYQGVPQITVQVKGKKVYDPRTTTTAWSSNAALCFLDYIQNDEYGKGLATADINMTTFETAADKCDVLQNQPYYGSSYQNVTWTGAANSRNICISNFDDAFQNKIDEVISIKDSLGTVIKSQESINEFKTNEFFGETRDNCIIIDSDLTSDYTNEAGSIFTQVKRFHCNGLVDTNKNVMDNAKELLANMRGIFTYIDGKYELQIEDTGSSTFSVTDDHIIADAGISIDYGSKDKKANKVIVEFFNANKKYELDTATEFHNATPNYYSDDGEILEIKAEFPYITDPYIAANMAKAILQRSRRQISIQFLGTPEMYKLNVGDIIDITYAGLDLSSTNGNNVFRVEALELQPDGLVSVSAIEYYDIYSWDVPTQEETADPTTPPTAGALKEPQNVTFTDTNASSIARPILSWDNPTDFPVKEFRVDVNDSSSNAVISKIVDTNSADLSYIPKDTNYNYSITAINGLGIESNATTGTFTVADEPVAEGDIQANAITANKINVTQLSSISSDLGSITGGSINIGSGNFTVDTAGNVVANSVTTRGKYLSKNISATGQAGLFSELSDSITGGSDPLRILCPSDDSDKDFFILMGDDPYSMTFSSGIPTSANHGLWFTGTGSIYMGGTSDSFSPLADDSNDLGRLNNRWDDVYATNGTIQTSDANDKSNIADSDLGISFVSQLTPRKYTLTNGDSNRTHYGLIAQEVKTVLDNNNISTSDFAPYIKGEILDTNNQGTGEYKHGLRYTELISILIKAIQELEQRIQDLEN